MIFHPQNLRSSRRFASWLALGLSLGIVADIGRIPIAAGEIRPPTDTTHTALIAAVSSNRIPQPRITTDALYRLSSLSGGMMDWRIPEGLFQQVRKSDTPSKALYLHITQREPSDVSAPYPDIDSRVSRSDTELLSLARRIVGSEKRAYFAARLLQQWVYRHIAPGEPDMQFANVRSTLASRRGDCSDRAIVLTKLAQTLGISARVAIGPVYMPGGGELPGKFVPHTWSEVLVGASGQGEWTPLDASFPQELMDATHIRLFDGSPDEPAALRLKTERMKSRIGRIRIETLRAVSPVESLLSLESPSGAPTIGLTTQEIAPIDIHHLSRRSVRSFHIQPPPEDISPDSPDGLFTQGMEALSRGDITEAEKHFRLSLDKLRRPVALYRMGERLTAIEMYALASEAFHRVVTADSKKQSASPYTEAVESWRTHFLAAANLPEPLNAKFLKALTLADQDHRAEAIALLQEVIRQSPGFTPAYRRLGEITTGPESLRWLRRAVALAPRDYRNQESLGDALMLRKRFDEATLAYQNACKVLRTARFETAPAWLSDARAKQNLASGSARLARDSRDAAGWLLTAQGLHVQHRSEEADQAYSNALSLRPGDPQALVGRFRLALERSDWQRMAGEQAAISRLAGSHAVAAGLLGEYRMRNRQYEAATQLLRQSIALNPHRPEPYLALSQVYRRLAELDPVSSKSTRQAQKKQSYRQSAYAALNRGLAAIPTSSERQDLTIALTQLLLEDIQAGKKEGKQAASALRLSQGLAAAHPLDGEALLLLGTARRLSGSRVSARTALEDALTLNPNNPNILLQLGHLALAEGRYAEATETYRKARLADPLNAAVVAADQHQRETLGIRDGKTKNFWYLTDDEHDYLVRILAEGRQLKLGLRSYLQRITELPVANGRVDFSVEGVQSIESFQPFVGRLYHADRERYEQLRVMRPPVRFSDLHRRVEAVCLSHMDVFNASLSRFPSLESVSEEDKATYGAALMTLNLAEQALSSEINAVSSRLPEAVFKGLAYEAQLNDISAINQEIARLSEVVASRHAGKKPTEVPVSLKPADLPRGKGALPTTIRPNGVKP